MKNKRLMSLILASGIVTGAGGISTVNAYANTTESNKVQVVQMDQNKLQKKACDLIRSLEKDPSEKTIKEARKLILQLDDDYFRNSYKYIIDSYVNKDLHNKISPIDIYINAYKNSLNIQSANTQGSFNMNLKGENLSSEEKQVLEGILPIINSMDISMDLKINSLEYNKKAKISGVIHLKNSFIKIDSKIWIDMDITKSTPEVSYIIEIPQYLKTFLPEEIANKKYLVFDMGSLLKNPELSKDKDIEDIKQQLQVTNMLQGKFIDELSDFIKIADANYNIIEPIKKENLHGNNLDNIKYAYEINLNNDKLMKVIKLALHDKDIKNTFWNCVNEISKMQEDVPKESITDKQKDDVVKGIEDMLEKLDKAVKCNIKSTVGIDEKGYCCYNKLTFNIVVDSKKISEFLGATNISNTNSKYTLVVNCDSNMSDINNNVKLDEKPQLTKNNTINFGEILASDEIK